MTIATKSKRGPPKMDPVSIKRRERYYEYMAKPGVRERIREKHRQRYKENPEYYQKFTRDWQARNPNYIKERCRENYLNGKHHDSNANRTPKMGNAHSKLQYHRPPMAKFCELCPEEELRPATMKHHPDYDYPLIFVSVCRACHTAHHRWEKKQQAEVCYS